MPDLGLAPARIGVLAGSIASTGIPNVDTMRTSRATSGLAARVATWSARHRTLAIVGWLLFVVLVTVLAGNIGTIEAKRTEQGHGDSRRAEQIVATAGFPNHASELVLVQSSRLTVDDPAFRATVAEVIAGVEATGQVESIRSPLAADAAGQISAGQVSAGQVSAGQVSAGQVSADRHSALVAFELRGDRETAKNRVGPVLDAVA